MTDSTGYLTGTSLGRFRVGELLGRGGMGEVYRAEDGELRRSVALKVLPESLVGDQDRLTRFIQEARSASALNHPHIVSIFDIGRAGNIHYIAMELVSGVTLRAALDQGRLDLKRALEYLGQAAEALAAAHAAGVVHRDLKPENLMIADGGYIKVLDFGLAKLRGEAAGAADGGATVTAGTAPGIVMGTIGYMSPEQALGRPVDQRSDIFSFGSVVYEAVTGSRPFKGDSIVDTLHRIIHADPAPVAERLPTAPSDLQRIVRKCLAKDPEERYQSMKEVAIDLRDLRRQLESGPVVATPPAARGFGRIAIAAVAVIVLAAGVGGFALWKNRRAPVVDRPSQLDIQTLTSSGNVIHAALSKDGNYLAYVESLGGQQVLWLRQVSGARPLEIVPAAPVGFFGLEFSVDGRFIYYTIKGREAPIGTLFQVPVLGGAPRAILHGMDSGPSFSPDGAQMVYLRAAYPDSGTSSVMIASADGSNSRPLATRKAPEMFSPGFFANPSWSPDGARVSASLRNTVTRDARLMTIAVADGAVTEFPERYADTTFTEWLPDGSGFLFVARKTGSAAPGFAGQIYLQPFPSGPVQRITNDLVDYRTARPGPDSRSLLAIGYDASASIWTAAVDDPASARQLPSSLRRDGFFGIDWTPDASRLVFGTFLRDHRETWTVAADGSDRRELLTEGQGFGTRVSPDGTFITFYGERSGGTGIWRARLDGTDARLLVPMIGSGQMSISSDGQWVYFSSPRSGAPSTYRVSTSGGEAILVADKLDQGVISPDGTLVAGIWDTVNGQSIGVLPVAGGPPVFVSQGVGFPTGQVTMLWSPDGTSVLYNSVERMNVWRQALAGGPPQKVTAFDDQTIFRFALTNDGKRLALVRGRQIRDALMISNFR